MSKTYCPLPWNHFSAGTEGNMRVCCNSWKYGEIKNNGKVIQIHEVNDPLTYFNTPQLKKLRATLLREDRARECTTCYDIEDSGGTSIRQRFVEKWPLENFIKSTNKATGEITKAQINYLDFSWSNKCNLKCKMCSPFASDQLIAEVKKFDLLKYFQNERLPEKNVWAYTETLDIIRKLVNYGLEEILVTGGEPLINNDFYEFCKFLIAEGLSKNLVLAFHSNLTVTPSKWFDIWPHFKYTIIRASIDAVDSEYEYVRYPGKWNIVKSNIEEIIDFINTPNSNTSMEFHTVISLHNIAGIPALIDYLCSFTETNNKLRVMPFVNYIYGPVTARVNLIPLKEREVMIDNIKKALDRNFEKLKNQDSINNVEFFKSLLNIALTDPVRPPFGQREVFDKLKEVDQYRGQDTYKFLPWLKELEDNNYYEQSE